MPMICEDVYCRIASRVVNLLAEEGLTYTQAERLIEFIEAELKNQSVQSSAV